MSSSRLSPEEFRAAAEVYNELGPQYGAAVAESFLEKINEEVEARVQARTAVLRPSSRQTEPDELTLRRTFVAGAGVGIATAGIPLTLMAIAFADDHGIDLAPLWTIWIIIGVIFTVAAAGATVSVAVRIRRPSEGASPASH